MAFLRVQWYLLYRSESVPSSKNCIALFLLFCCAAPRGEATSQRIHQPSHSSQAVAQCTDVSLHASYLVEETVGRGPAFLLEIQNSRNAAITIAEPVPLSIHWYVHTGNQWLWRASSGSGGALLDAMHEHGPVLADTLPAGKEYHSTEIGPHTVYTSTVLLGSSPSLAYHPGCEHCGVDKEREYRAVLAYAMRPVPGQSGSNWLQCGLRSNAVVMPPLEESKVFHNFQPVPGSLQK